MITLIAQFIRPLIVACVPQMHDYRKVRTSETHIIERFQNSAQVPTGIRMDRTVRTERFVLQ